MADAPQTQESVKGPKAERIARPAIVGAIIALVLFAAFVALAASIGSPGTTAFDTSVRATVQSWRTPARTTVVLHVTDLGTAPAVIVIVTAVVVFALIQRRRAEAVLVLVVLGVGRTLGSVAQLAVHRVRPAQASALIPLPTTYSFPSGHSITSMLLYGVLAFLAWRFVRAMWLRVLAVAACVVLIVSIGLSRIYLGVHWPSDVVGAWLLGGAWLALCCGVYLSWERSRASS